MSKMSQLAMELDEQAVELGFRDREDAMNNGYEVMSDGNFARLVETETEQDKAHEAWLAEREEIITELENLITAYAGAEGVVKPVRKAIEFIMKGEV